MQTEMDSSQQGRLCHVRQALQNNTLAGTSDEVADFLREVISRGIHESANLDPSALELFDMFWGVPNISSYGDLVNYLKNMPPGSNMSYSGVLSRSSVQAKVQRVKQQLMGELPPEVAERFQETEFLKGVTISVSSTQEVSVEQLQKFPKDGGVIVCTINRSTGEVTHARIEREGPETYRYLAQQEPAYNSSKVIFLQRPYTERELLGVIVLDSYTCEWTDGVAFLRVANDIDDKIKSLVGQAITQIKRNCFSLSSGSDESETF